MLLVAVLTKHNGAFCSAGLATAMAGRMEQGLVCEG